jgi:hypothetical protein
VRQRPLDRLPIKRTALKTLYDHVKHSVLQFLEGRDNYRRRLLHPLQPHSATYKHSDLRVAQVDPVAFDAIEKDIYASAEQGFKNPATVPFGHLREHKETRGGHEYTKFIGRPISWMAAFAPPGKRVRRIIERSDSNNRTLYERN